MIAPTAIVETTVPESTKVWNWTHIREDAVIGENCVIGEHVYIDHGVVVGNGCKIQNGANLYAPLELGDYVFIGPGVVVCNDRRPRAWHWDPTASPVTKICSCASAGARAVILPGVTVHESAVIGAGSVVVKDVSANTTVVGNPARVVS